MKCPKCGSEHVQFATTTSGGGFSFSNSCCGYILLGPLGLLCGTIGSRSQTDEFWICHDCGHEFSTEAGKAKIQSDQEQLRKAQQEKNEYEASKASLASLPENERNPETILSNYEAAREAVKNSKTRYKQVLRNLAGNKDRKVRKFARRLQRNWPNYINATVAVLGGIFMLFGLFPVGIPLLLISLIAYIVCGLRQEKAKEFLLQQCPEFKPAQEELDAANAHKKYCEELKEKLEKVHAYETKQHDK